MTKTLIFLEDPEKIDWIIQDSAKITGQFVYISLSPSVSYAFEKFKIPYKPIHDYGGREERYPQILENFQRIDRIVTILDKELEHLHDISTLTPARYTWCYPKILLDMLWIEIQILKRIIDTEQPDFIRLYAKPQAKYGERLLPFSNDESVYNKVLNMPGWNVPIEIIRKTEPDIPDQRIMGQKNTPFSRVLAWIKEQNFFFNLGLIGKRDGIGSVAAALYYYVTCWHRKPVLIYESGYNWNDSLLELYKAGMIPVYRIRDETFNKILSGENNYWEEVRKCREEVQKVCNKHPGMREFDQVLGIDVSAFFFDWLSRIVGRSIQDSITVYPITLRIIHQKKIHCLLHSVRSYAIGHAIVQAAHDAGIPVVSWQHGGSGYCYNPIMPFIEFINSDWHFVFGEGVAGSYRFTSESIGLEKIPVFVPVGSSSLDTFHRNGKNSGIKQANKPVVYITTGYFWNIYLMQSVLCDPLYWDEHLWDIQKQVINLAKKNPDKEFIIKLYPLHTNKEPLLSYITDHGIKNVKLITSEMTVRELTDIADVVIFDLISTGILQVLTSDLPVFVYSGLHAIDEDTLLQLKKRAYVNDNIESFTANIDEYLKTKQVAHSSVDFLNGDFLMRYGTDIHTYNSAGRAIVKLKEIISGWEFRQL